MIMCGALIEPSGVATARAVSLSDSWVCSLVWCAATMGLGSGLDDAWQPQRPGSVSVRWAP